MNDELQQKLYTKYPEILKNGLYFVHSDCGDGWFALIDCLCSDIHNHIEHVENSQKWELSKYNKLSWFKKIFTSKPKVKLLTVKAVQIKEKFGGLRFYADGTDDYVRGLISMAESMSYNICDVCGNLGKYGGRGWVSTRCDNHR